MTPSYGMIARRIRAARPWSSRGGLNAQNGVAFRNRDPLHRIYWHPQKHSISWQQYESCVLQPHVQPLVLAERSSASPTCIDSVLLQAQASDGAEGGQSRCVPKLTGIDHHALQPNCTPDIHLCKNNHSRSVVYKIYCKSIHRSIGRALCQHTKWHWLATILCSGVHLPRLLPATYTGRCMTLPTKSVRSSVQVSMDSLSSCSARRPLSIYS